MTSLRAEVKGTFDKALDEGWNEDNWTEAVLTVFADWLRNRSDDFHREDDHVAGSVLAYVIPEVTS